MKLITDRNMRTISSIAASSEAAGFAAANLLQHDPALVWKAAAFSGNVTLTADLGAAGQINFIWLNNANFLNATIQANSANTWDSPAVSKAAVMAEDDVGVIKGVFEFSASPLRYVRVVIPVQALTDGSSVPFLGNLILGQAQEMIVSTWRPQVVEEFNDFLSDGGSYHEASKGKARHIFSVGILNEPKSVIDSLPIKGWEVAIIDTEFGSVADSYLVYRPKGKQPVVRSPIDCDIEFVLRELV